MHSVRNLMHLSRLISMRQTVRCIVECQRCLATSDSIDKSVAKSKISFVNMPPAMDQVKVHELQIDWDKEMDAITKEEYENSRSILAPVEDEHEIYAEPMVRPTFNLAHYVQKSETLQQFLKMGVELHIWDDKGAGQFVANLDFKHDVEPYILFFTRQVGIPLPDISQLFTRNPDILKENLDDIQTRINYLQLKRFKSDDIVRIVVKNAHWLNWSTQEIDERLGYFQRNFALTGDEVRWLAVRCPRLITHKLQWIKEMSFSVKEECCFEPHEMKQILLKCPKLWMLNRMDFMGKYDFVTKFMKIDNAQLATTPNILENRLFRIKERHGFLKKINRAQYDPKKPLYISLDTLCVGNDNEFAENVAKRPYEEYDRYLRTL